MSRGARGVFVVYIDQTLPRRLYSKDMHGTPGLLVKSKARHHSVEAPTWRGDPVAVKVSTAELLLDSLIDNPNIRAAIMVDENGYILEQRGNARCVRSVEDEEATIQMSKRPQMENIYLVEAGENFLIVVFDERMNFERLKNSVDSTLENFDLAPERE